MLVLLFFEGELDVASGINGVDVVRKIPHLTLLYQKIIWKRLVAKLLACTS